MNKALAGRTDDDYLRDIRAGADYLKGHEAVKAGGVGILGFCSGGRRALMYAVRFDGVKAVVAFHPAAHTKAEEVIGLKVPVQFHHGKADRVSPFTVSQELEKQLRSQDTPGGSLPVRRCGTRVPGVHPPPGVQARRRTGGVETHGGVPGSLSQEEVARSERAAEPFAAPDPAGM